MGTEPSRLVAFDGGHNFRDLGGYRTCDGRRLRWRRLFRSGLMSEFTADDLERIKSLDIRFICDLRSNPERASRPTRWPNLNAINRWWRDHEGSTGDVVRALSVPHASAQSMRELMIEAYRTLPYEQADSYRELFRAIADGELPLVFHCSAGKDRTGIAAALLLSALGVPRDTVIDDYLLTERFFEGTCRLAETHGFNQIDPVIWEPLMRAEHAYLDAMFGALEQRHGSVDGYLVEILGVDAVLKQRMAQQLLD
jgi:protein-tyrosine phosphatase